MRFSVKAAIASFRLAVPKSTACARASSPSDSSRSVRTSRGARPWSRDHPRSAHNLVGNARTAPPARLPNEPGERAPSPPLRPPTRFDRRQQLGRSRGTTRRGKNEVAPMPGWSPTRTKSTPAWCRRRRGEDRTYCEAEAGAHGRPSAPRSGDANRRIAKNDQRSDPLRRGSRLCWCPLVLEHLKSPPAEKDFPSPRTTSTRTAEPALISGIARSIWTMAAVMALRDRAREAELGDPECSVESNFSWQLTGES